MSDFLCSNPQRRDHAGWYGADAFYDLELIPRENRKFAKLKPGDVCVVATPIKKGETRGPIAFRWFLFRNGEPMLDPKPKRPGTKVQIRVLFGKPTLPRRTPTFEFFKANGGFKRRQTIKAV
jgi:hypothetical protein